MIYSGVDKRRLGRPDNDQGITEFEYYGKTVEEKAKEAPVRAERHPMGHRGALHDPYAAAAGAGATRIEREATPLGSTRRRRFRLGRLFGCATFNRSTGCQPLPGRCSSSLTR